jgi:conjugative relaxase-like TrwC/TraI family protein
MLAAVDPSSGKPLKLARRRPDRLPGFDLTFSAPKSVSLLFALGDDDLAMTVRAAHDAAVTQAVGYLERQAGHARRGTDGAMRQAVAGSSRPRSGIARRGRGIHICIRMC